MFAIVVIVVGTAPPYSHDAASPHLGALTYITSFYVTSTEYNRELTYPQVTFPLIYRNPLVKSQSLNRTQCEQSAE